MTQIISPPAILPVVQIANDIPVRQGTSWGPRKIYDLELVFVVDGELRYERPKTETVPVRAGEVLCIPPETLHTPRHVSAAGQICCIHCELLPAQSWAAGDYRLDPEPLLVTPVGADARLSALFHECAAVYAGYAAYRDALVQTLVREIWLRLAACWQAPAHSPISPRMAAMIAYLRAHLEQPVSRQALADAFALTPQHVNALFRQELGTSPTQFLHRERILHACRLLQHDGLPLQETAARVGFQDVFYFSRIFKKVTGMAPSRFR